MLQINLGAARYQPDDQDDDFLPRTLAGWDQAMTEAQVYDAARGWWRLNANRVRIRNLFNTSHGHIHQPCPLGPVRDSRCRRLAFNSAVR